jgi:hypothetical protein
MRIHNIEYECSIEKKQNNIPNQQNNIPNQQNNILNQQNNIPNQQNNIPIQQNIADNSLETTNNNNQCLKCNKIMSSKQSLQRHTNICKGITNSLECHLCHKVFAFTQGKIKHLKKCTESTALVVSQQDPSTITNIDNSQTADTINNNITNNNIITNNITNNIIVYNDTNIELQDNHITKKDLKRIFNGATTQTVQSIMQYAQKLLENIDNRCIQKKHLTNSYCKVHTGNGVWETRPETAVIDRFSQDVAISANDKLYVHPTIGKDNLRKEITELASEPEDVHSSALHVRREMKALIYDISKQ